MKFGARALRTGGLDTRGLESCVSASDPGGTDRRTLSSLANVEAVKTF
jgi:hypothetical protein